VSRAAASALAVVILVLAGALPVAAADDAAQGDGALAGEIVPGEVVVGWRNPERGAGVVRARGLALVADLDIAGRGASAAVLSTRGRSVSAVIAELSADPAVAYAEPNYLFSLPDYDIEGGVAAAAPSAGGEIAGVPVDDTYTAGQYSLDRMRVRDAWSREKGGSNLIAVLDTGVQSGHPDLRGRVVKGYDFVNNDTGASDDNGHGTWVAGIIAAKANDGYGIAGISWTDRILPVKIMNASGTGSTADLAAGITWAANRGADVINMSVGGFPYSQAIQDAVNHAWSRGAVLIGAAGNNNRRENFYPASYDHVVSVSATQVEDEFSRWSSYGPKVDVSAPGSSVLTTNCTASACPHRDWGSHTYISGTSFATPNVAGVTALIKARYPSYTASQIVGRLRGTVDDLGYAGRDDRYGLGRVNAYRALGASVARPKRLSGDSFERNNSLASAAQIGIGRTTDATIYPAGDQDWFRVWVPRAGRLDVRVTGVVDTRAYPWNRSGLPIDPIVELYKGNGTLITRVDRQWEGGVELAQHKVGRGTAVIVRVFNYYANGNRIAYTVTPKFVDTVAPVATIRAPAAGSTEITQWVSPVATFNEVVQNVSSSTVRLRDMETNQLVPASVSYDAARRQVRLTPADRLDGHHDYRFELGAAITDRRGNSLAPTHARFRTSLYAFRDIQGTPYAAQIQWTAVRHIIPGCGSERFCPTTSANRAVTALALDRALDLAPTSRDYFTDDEGMPHEDAINRVRAAGLMTSCATARFCPRDPVRRGHMAVILVRALDLPAVPGDFFTDDEGKSYEDAVNRVAAAGLMTGCGSTTFCPTQYVRRQELADIVYRALAD
jgi:type VII secretion-associated serine protease mycosin